MQICDSSFKVKQAGASLAIPQNMAKLKKTFFHNRNGIVKVKIGFSWPAFFFGSIWAAARRMWLPEFLLLLVADVGLWFLTGVAEAKHEGGLALLGLTCTIAYAVVRGRYGNSWVMASLLRRGYVQHGGTNADA